MTTGEKWNIKLFTVYPLIVTLLKSLIKMKYSSKGQLLLASAAESLEKTRSSIILLYITGKTAIFLPIIFVGPLLLQVLFFPAL